MRNKDVLVDRFKHEYVHLYSVLDFSGCFRFLAFKNATYGSRDILQFKLINIFMM